MLVVCVIEEKYDTDAPKLNETIEVIGGKGDWLLFNKYKGHYYHASSFKELSEYKRDWQTQYSISKFKG